MKESILSICLAMTAALALNAQVYTGTIYVTQNGQTNTETATITILDQENGDNLHTIEMQVPLMGNDVTLRMFDVPSACSGSITTYSAERDVPSGTNLGTINTVVFARVTDGLMTANVAIPDQDITMWFNTVGDHFQLPNSNMEAWTASTGEPDRWHGFKSAGGTLANISAGVVKLEQSTDVRQGTTGYSVVMTANSLMGIVANGTMTNGRLMAQALSAGDPRNHAEMDKTKTNTDANGDLFYMPLYAKPDKFNAWMKFTPKNSNNKASVSVKTFDGTYYQEPVDKVYTNLSGSIVGGDIPASGWTQYSFPFDYDSYAANGAASEAIFVTFSTNGNPGSGSSGDALYVDDMELVYLGNMTDLRYQGVTLDGWNPAVTTYAMEMAGEPNLDDFTATIEGVSAVLTKSMEQNQDGSYRIAISVVAGDLQQAACYIINVTQPATQVKPGDVDDSGTVDIADVSALIDVLLTGNYEGINVKNADVDGDTAIGISDVSALIDILLQGN